MHNDGGGASQWDDVGLAPSRMPGTSARDPFGFPSALAVSLRKPPIMRVGFPWISLDSLVRIETYQWVTRKIREKIFPLAFPPGMSSTGSESAVWAYRRGGLVMGASLTRVLIYSKKLSTLTGLAVGRPLSAARSFVMAACPCLSRPSAVQELKRFDVGP